MVGIITELQDGKYIKASKREKEQKRHHHLVRFTMQRVENLIKNDFKTTTLQ